jgi:hypothetical protein
MEKEFDCVRVIEKGREKDERGRSMDRQRDLEKRQVTALERKQKAIGREKQRQVMMK